jgi:hypothetical protein
MPGVPPSQSADKTASLDRPADPAVPHGPTRRPRPHRPLRPHLEDYRSGRYNETQVRREFIDPFFKCLGWDIDNEHGFACGVELRHQGRSKLDAFLANVDSSGRAGRVCEGRQAIGAKSAGFADSARPMPQSAGTNPTTL